MKRTPPPHRRRRRIHRPGMNRRHFLRGVGGVLMSLPFLESLQPRGAYAQDNERPHYSVFIRQGNGVAQQTRNEEEMFWPRQLGRIDSAILGEQNSDRAVSELADWADRLLMVRGCNYPYGGGDCGHSAGMAQCITAAQHTAGTANSTMALGMSVDVRIANELTPDTPGLNLVAARITNAYIGANLSYSGPRQRRPAEANPYNVYLDLFANSGDNPEVINRLAVQRKSVNDLVREEMQSLLRRPLSTNDRRRLAQHFDAISDIEASMACNGISDGSLIAEFERFNPSTNELDAEGQEYRDMVVDLQMQLIAAAFSCDLVRTAVLQIGTGNDQTIYTFDGQQLPFRFHWISHRIQGDGNEGAPIENAQILHHQIDRKFARYFRRMCELLDERVTIAGYNLLDESVAVWLNDLSTGVAHGRNNMPYIIAGSGGGTLKQGQYVDAGGVTHNKFFNTILTAVGCTNGQGGPVEDFGDSSLEGGLIPEMLSS